MTLFEQVAAGAVVLVIGGGVWTYTQNQTLRGTVAEQARELAVQQAVAEQAREARDVLDAHLTREAARSARMQATMETILTGDFENADMVLDARIGAILDCLRRGDPDEDCGAAGAAGTADAGSDQ